MEMELKFLPDVLSEKSPTVLIRTKIICLFDVNKVVSLIITLYFACFCSNMHCYGTT